MHAAMARLTHGLSPASLGAAAGDWLTHLALSPGKQQQLGEKALRKLHRLILYMMRSARSGCAPCIEPLPQDLRFRHSDWQECPFNLIYQSFLLLQQWWWNATTEVRGVTPHHEQVMTFVTRQLLDVFSPSNFPWTNPEVLRETMRTGGMNLVKGAANWWDDVERLAAGRRPEGADAFEVGKDVAVTPGNIIFRNRLIELIQYRPATTRVYREPVLIVPSWIMKYYVLDLSPHNSLVRYLVGQGHTVFMISWKNPDASDRELGMNDYLRQGVMAALDAVVAVLPKRRIQAVGYCLGGTLLATAAACLARERDTRLRSLTLLAAEVDFEEPGELSLFIDESQVAYLEDLMWDQGYLDGKQMAGAFTLLNSKDLVWSRVVRDYLIGRRRPLTDLMAWNADATRLPYRMHTEYLRNFYLRNELAEGRYEVGGKPVVLSDIDLPLFAVGTVRDHVSPWRSVYRIHLLTDTELTFLLTTGGHNAGVVSEPGHANRSYQVATRRRDARYVDPDTWHATVPVKEGSWWPEWQRWLRDHSSGRARPPAMGAPARGYAPLAQAPGQYVLVP
ncbi:MAG: PHA/PHB synthase family protein [Burkholderiales bacterium]